MDDSTKALLGVVGAVGIVIAAELYLKYKKQQVQAQAATQTQQQQQVQQAQQTQTQPPTYSGPVIIVPPQPVPGGYLPERIIHGQSTPPGRPPYIVPTPGVVG